MTSNRSVQRITFVALLVAIFAVGSFAFSVTPSVHKGYQMSSSRFVLQAASEGVEEKETSEEPPKPEVKCPDCDMCDGSGRILGGIAVVLPWWPIKAYRPCPNFINRGGTYERSGQGLDEIAFGRDSTYNGN